MSNSDIPRNSALDGHYSIGKSGEISADGSAGVILENVQGSVLYQVAGWVDTMDKVGTQIAKAAKAESAPGPCQAVVGEKGALLRVEPMKWWLIDVTAPVILPKYGTSLDLSHSRTRIRISGSQAVEFLNRFLPLDLREREFPQGFVASSAIHHVGVTLWHAEGHYDLFIPRGFALFVWENLVDVAQQFGLEII
ncbi:MAG: sarcosine oxidase subunit gamma [Gammaproteobacteria bacterium]|nr:sarcosine oxidase subunit gamma [Gammaproteobacteria bacterium]MCY4219601.1 sarcosine oxidase subunit gamma [Gammaproteobacteria bacterium]MCY4274145.1 sarcosine oxidase subunit gamma [Gammaproteobacteria bacterium]